MRAVHRKFDEIVKGTYFYFITLRENGNSETLISKSGAIVFKCRFYHSWNYVVLKLRLMSTKQILIHLLCVAREIYLRIMIRQAMRGR